MAASDAATLRRRDFPDRDAMADALAETIAAQLADGLAARGEASFAASGGATPAPVYRRLADAELAWHRVHVALVDERWVGGDDPGSNEAFLRATLLQNRAAGARLVGLKTSAATPGRGLAEAAARLATVPQPFDAVLLGLGADGHTASWFPEAEGLAAALAPEAAPLAAIRAVASPVAGPYRDRITLTAPVIAAARWLGLLITGAQKAEALARARAPGPVAAAPIRALLRNPRLALDVYWAP